MISRSIAPAIANSFFLLLLPRIKYEENTTIAARQKIRQKKEKKRKKAWKRVETMPLARQLLLSNSGQIPLGAFHLQFAIATRKEGERTQWPPAIAASYFTDTHTHTDARRVSVKSLAVEVRRGVLSAHRSSSKMSFAMPRAIVSPWSRS